MSEILVSPCIVALAARAEDMDIDEESRIDRDLEARFVKAVEGVKEPTKDWNQASLLETAV